MDGVGQSRYLGPMRSNEEAQSDRINMPGVIAKLSLYEMG